MSADVDVDVRIAGAADLQALVQLVGVFRDHLGRSTPLNVDLRASIATLLKDPGTEFFLAGSGLASCGYVQCRYRYSAWSSAPEAELEDVFVVHEARRRGHQPTHVNLEGRGPSGRLYVWFRAFVV